MANDEHYTPFHLVELVRKSIGGVNKQIDLDPASSSAANSVVLAKHFMSKDDNCLTIENWQAWCGSDKPIAVFMNPPYSRSAGGAGTFVNKLIRQWDAGYISEAVVLLNNCTDTLWWKPLWQFSHCFVAPRIAFLDQTLNVQNSPRYGNVFVHIYDKNDVQGSTDRFKKLFSKIGHVTNCPAQ